MSASTPNSPSHGFLAAATTRAVIKGRAQDAATQKVARRARMKPIVPTWLSLVVFLLLCNSVQSQENMEIDAKYRTADTNNAVIEGRVSLPSGFAAERYVKITVRNSQVTLFNRYTSTHGEFRFDNLAEGVYYIK